MEMKNEERRTKKKRKDKMDGCLFFPFFLPFQGIYSSVGLSEFVNPLIDSAADTQ